MKIKHAILPCAAALLLVGCDSGQKKESTPSPDALTVPGGVAPSALAETKEAFLAAVDKQLAGLDTKIAELRKKSETYKDDAKTAADQALATLGEQRTKLSAQQEELKKSSGDAWKEAKAGFATALAALEKAYEDAKAKFN